MLETSTCNTPIHRFIALRSPHWTGRRPQFGGPHLVRLAVSSDRLVRQRRAVLGWSAASDDQRPTDVEAVKAQGNKPSHVTPWLIGLQAAATVSRLS
jgi:hypothetical protein